VLTRGPPHRRGCRRSGTARRRCRRRPTQPRRPTHAHERTASIRTGCCRAGRADTAGRRLAPHRPAGPPAVLAVAGLDGRRGHRRHSAILAGSVALLGFGLDSAIVITVWRFTGIAPFRRPPSPRAEGRRGHVLPAGARHRQPQNRIVLRDERPCPRPPMPGPCQHIIVASFEDPHLGPSSCRGRASSASSPWAALNGEHVGCCGWWTRMSPLLGTPTSAGILLRRPIFT
jgi:hypothetical protein